MTPMLQQALLIMVVALICNLYYWFSDRRALAAKRKRNADDIHSRSGDR
jgi:NADH:ubiquinone oxidoreductase subunit H